MLISVATTAYVVLGCSFAGFSLIILILVLCFESRVYSNPDRIYSTNPIDISEALQCYRHPVENHLQDQVQPEPQTKGADYEEEPGNDGNTERAA
jgi:hypothetical protein